jgi:hypothetical protein
VRRAVALGALLLLQTAGAADASPRPASFAGSCQFSGPIAPERPISLIPVPNARFSYRGSGSCDGQLDAAPVHAAHLTVAFDHVTTAFDTCELGPDFDLHGSLTISAQRVDTFAIVVNLARLALIGPFSLTTAGGGQALGIAEFTPADPSTAVQQCASSGLNDASLAASFNTSAPLAGVAADPPAPPAGARSTACTDLRRFVYSLHAAHGERIVRVDISVDGRHVARVGGRRLKHVALAALSKSAHRVTVVTRSDRGTVRISVRAYSACGQSAPRTVVVARR